MTQETIVDEGEASARVKPLDEEPETPAHVLHIGGKEFVCRDHLPMTVFVRYAENDFLFKFHLLSYLVDPAEHEEMWDAIEEAGRDGKAMDAALRDLLRSYSARPTEAP